MQPPASPQASAGDGPGKRTVPDEPHSLLLDLEPPESPPMKLRHPPAWLRRYAPALTFLGGLLLGWLAIGWWLWPVRWANCSPWDLQPAYQERFVALVAAEQWRTGDAARARADLAGWDSQALSALLTAMENKASDPESRQQLVALQQALLLPGPASSPQRSLPRPSPILWSAALAALLQLAAVAVAIAPHIVSRTRSLTSVQGEPESLFAPQERQSLAPWLKSFEGLEQDASDTPAAPASEPQAQKSQRTEDGKPGARPTKQAPAEGNQALQRVRVDDTTTATSTAKVQVAQRNRAELQREQPNQQDHAYTQAAQSEPLADEANEPSDLLSDILEGIELLDSRRAVLTELAQKVDIADLVQQSGEVLAQLQSLSLAQREETSSGVDA